MIGTIFIDKTSSFDIQNNLENSNSMKLPFQSSVEFSKFDSVYVCLCVRERERERERGREGGEYCFLMVHLYNSKMLNISSAFANHRSWMLTFYCHSLIRLSLKHFFHIQTK